MFAMTSTLSLRLTECRWKTGVLKSNKVLTLKAARTASDEWRSISSNWESGDAQSIETEMGLQKLASVV